MRAQHGNTVRRKVKPPRQGPFLVGSRQLSDWLLRWREVFAGKDPSLPRGKTGL